MLLLKRKLSPAGGVLSLAAAPEMINAAGLLAWLLEAAAGFCWRLPGWVCRCKRRAIFHLLCFPMLGRELRGFLRVPMPRV